MKLKGNKSLALQAARNDTFLRRNIFTLIILPELIQSFRSLWTFVVYYQISIIKRKIVCFNNFNKTPICIYIWMNSIRLDLGNAIWIIMTLTGEFEQIRISSVRSLANWTLIWIYWMVWITGLQEEKEQIDGKQMICLFSFRCWN